MPELITAASRLLYQADGNKVDFSDVVWDGGAYPQTLLNGLTESQKPLSQFATLKIGGVDSVVLSHTKFNGQDNTCGGTFLVDTGHSIHKIYFFASAHDQQAATRLCEQWDHVINSIEFVRTE
jgi:hypothetical protein